MRPFLLCLLLLAANQAIAAESYSYRDSSGNQVRLYDAECAVSTGWLKLKRAIVKWHGKEYAACWMIIKTTVIIVDESGDAGTVPAQMFSKDSQT